MLKARFDFVRYANCWEDADVLLAALKPAPGSNILSVASGGDNSLALLSTGPRRILLTDINPVQLYLVELKALCFKKLSYPELLYFFTEPSLTHVRVFNTLRLELSANARSWFDRHIQCIENGIVYEGKFEKYLQSVGRLILPLIHSRKTTRRLFEPKTAMAQKVFYEHTWNNYRWRWLFRFFFNRKMLGVFGRDPEFMKQVEVQVSAFLYDRAAQHLSSTDVQHNYFLAYMLLGRFTYGLPFYLREENYESIRSNIGALELRECYVQEPLLKGERFSHFNFSNIFEYMPEATFNEFANTLATHMAEGARLAYWNLMVPRCFSAQWPEHFSALPNPPLPDYGFFYNAFINETKR